MKNVSRHRILNTKQITINQFFISFCPFYSPIRVSFTSPLAVSRNTGTPFSTLPLFRLGNILLESLNMFIGDGCHDFRK